MSSKTSRGSLMGMVCLRWASMSACKEAQLGWGVGILSGAGLTGKGSNHIEKIKLGIVIEV